MANTKRLTRSMRRGVKRSQRRELKALYAGMTADVRAKFNDPEEKKGLRAFLKSREGKA